MGLSLGGLRNGLQLNPFGGGAYVGPLDLVTGVAAAYSVARLLRAAYSGPLVRIRRASDNVEQDFYALASGALDTASIATFLTATTGAFVTVYDQSGNGKNAAQATTTKQPLYTASGPGSKPTATFDGSDDYLKTGAIAALDTDLQTWFAVGKNSNSAGSTQILARSKYTSGAGASSTALVGLFRNSDNTDVAHARNAAGTIKLSAFTPSDALANIWELVWAADDTITLVRNGAAQTAGTGADAVPAGHILTTIGINSVDETALPWNGSISEFYIYPSTLSAASRLALRSNLSSFFTIALP